MQEHGLLRQGGDGRGRPACQGMVASDEHAWGSGRIVRVSNPESAGGQRMSTRSSDPSLTDMERRLSSMKGRLKSSAGWSFLTFCCWLVVVMVGFSGE
jgi:hypothetical protein